MTWIAVGLGVAALASQAHAGSKERKAIRAGEARAGEARAEGGRRSRQRIGEVETFAQRYAPQSKLSQALTDTGDFERERAGILSAQAPGAPQFDTPEALAWQGQRVADEGARMSEIVRNLGKLDATGRGKFRDALAEDNFSSDYGSQLGSDRNMVNAMLGEAQQRLGRAGSAGSGWRLASSLFSTAGGMYGGGMGGGRVGGYAGNPTGYGGFSGP